MPKHLLKLTSLPIDGLLGKNRGKEFVNLQRLGPPRWVFCSWKENHTSCYGRISFVKCTCTSHIQTARSKCHWTTTLFQILSNSKVHWTRDIFFKYNTLHLNCIVHEHLLQNERWPPLTEHQNLLVTSPVWPHSYSQGSLLGGEEYWSHPQHLPWTHRMLQTDTTNLPTGHPVHHFQEI